MGSLFFGRGGPKKKWPHVGGLYRRDVYLLALERGKWDAPDLLERTTAFLAAHRPRRPSPAKVRGVYIEDKSGGTGLIQSLRRIVSLCDMPVIAVQRNRDKVSRVHDVVPFIRAGRLVAPEAAPWLTAYMGELAAFSPAMPTRMTIRCM